MLKYNIYIIQITESDIKYHLLGHNIQLGMDDIDTIHVNDITNN